MGLAGRKTKQRIGADPRNLSWANDASKFGTSYLQKFGWDSGQGLGATGEGRKTHISVHQKLDILGIGADHKNSENGTAWKQGRDYEALLKRLNVVGTAGEEQEEMRVSGFVRPGKEAEDQEEVGTGEEEVEEVEQAQSSKAKESKKSKKKRKHEGDANSGSEGKEKKKRKKSESSEEKEHRRKERKEKKEKKKREADVIEAESSQTTEKSTTVEANASSVVTTTVQKTVTIIARPVRAHRARHIAAKGLASKSTAAIAEILGVSGSSTPSLTSSLDPSLSSTPFTDPSSPANPVPFAPPLEKLSTSSKSVMDYFREKLTAKSRPASSAPTPPSERERDAWDEYDERPRGLGIGSRMGMSMGTARMMEMAFTAGTSQVETKVDVSAAASKQESETDTAGAELKDEADKVKTKKEKKDQKKYKKGKAKEIGLANADVSEAGQEMNASADGVVETPQDANNSGRKVKKEKRKEKDVSEDAQEHSRKEKGSKKKRVE